MHEYRLTRIGHARKGAKPQDLNGHYITAPGMSASVLEMAKRFPEDIIFCTDNDGELMHDPFSVQLWKENVDKVVATHDRVLHYSNEDFKAKVDEMANKARAISISTYSSFQDGLEYLRTFSGGSEADGWKTILGSDMPSQDMNIIAVIMRNGKPFMTIGMIYDHNTKDWSFHS